MIFIAPRFPILATHSPHRSSSTSVLARAWAPLKPSFNSPQITCASSLPASPATSLIRHSPASRSPPSLATVLYPFTPSLKSVGQTLFSCVLFPTSFSRILAVIQLQYIFGPLVLALVVVFPMSCPPALSSMDLESIRMRVPPAGRATHWPTGEYLSPLRRGFPSSFILPREELGMSSTMHRVTGLFR